jgi:hypothetical protein
MFPFGPGTSGESGRLPGKKALVMLNKLKMLTLGVIFTRSFNSGMGQASSKSNALNQGKFSAPGATEGSVGITQPIVVISAEVITPLLTIC